MPGVPLEQAASNKIGIQASGNLCDIWRYSPVGERPGALRGPAVADYYNDPAATRRFDSIR